MEPIEQSEIRDFRFFLEPFILPSLFLCRFFFLLPRVENLRDENGMHEDSRCVIE